MDDEECPKCGAMFPADRAWANRSLAMSLFGPALQDLDTRVRCPSCGTVFQASGFRFFGFIPPRLMKIMLGLFAAAVVVGAVYFLFIDAP